MVLIVESGSTKSDWVLLGSENKQDIYSSMGFNLQTTDDYNSANSISSRLFGADGNINRAFLSVGVPFLKYFSLGATANYNFGKFNYEKFDFQLLHFQQEQHQVQYVKLSLFHIHVQ